MAVRKKDLLRVSLFNDTLLSSGDVELCSRVIKHFYEIYYEPSAIVHHYYPKSVWLFIKKNIFYGKGLGILRRKNKYKFMTKHISCLSIIRTHGFMFAIFKLLQGISFRLGLVVGYLSIK